MTTDYCEGCGGGLDGDCWHICTACLYEKHTGRSFKRDADTAIALGVPFREYAKRHLTPKNGA